jgi:hypothetical protein
MAKVSIVSVDKAKTVPSPPGSGGIESRELLGKPSDPIHLQQHRLEPGANLTLAADPADLAIFVWKGAVRAGGADLREKSSVVLEQGASMTMQASDQGASVLAFHLSEQGPGKTSGGHVHILPAERVPRTEAMGGNEGIGGALHSDAQCPTCSVWLHENSYAMADKETALHSHSEDEVIFIHSGSIKLGNRIYGPGTALAIGADVKYEFWSGPDGLGFVNFRGTSPTYTSADGKTVLDEAELWRGILGQPEYLEAAS